MATFFDDIYKDAKVAWAEIADFIPLISNGSGKINDINKKAGDNTVNMYAVVSENVPASVRAIIARNLQVKYVAAVMLILKNTVLKDPTKADSFFRDRLSNTDKTTKLQGHVDSVIGSSLVEALVSRMPDIPLDSEIIFNESNLTEAGVNTTTMRNVPPSRFSQQVHGAVDTQLTLRAKEQHDLEHAALVQDTILATKRLQAAELSDSALKKAIEKQERLIANSTHLRISSGSVNSNKFGGLNKSDYLEFPEIVNASFSILDRDLRPHLVEISFGVNVKMMEIESQKIKDVIISTKERDNFFQYLKYRAGASHFFKDFILNLKEIEKEVERNTNQTLANRILTDMIRTSGLLTPKILGDLSETRHYSLILDKSDVDDLRRNSKIDIESRGPLVRLFEKLCILNLLICNPDRNELTFYDSSDPTKYDIKNYAKITSDDDLLKRFVMSMK